MDKVDKFQNGSASKGNSEDSLLAIYILSVLKKYSSHDNKLSSQEVMDYLKKDYCICDLEEADSQRKKVMEAQRKKVRRYLHTLSESYWGGCVKKEEGKTAREGHKWYYDISRDKFADKEVVIQETLTETEVDFLVDLISAAKILNSKGTRGLIDKLLRKMPITKEDRKRRLWKIEREGWLKTPNEDLIEKKDYIQECIDENDDIVFDYENEEAITATPLKWIYDGGTCFLNAIVENTQRKFSLDKIRNYYYKSAKYEDFEDFRLYEEATDSDKTALDSLFVNIPTIKSAIADKKCLNFMYRSYEVANGCVVSTDEEKSVLPHSLVFNDGKYYLIGIDENVPGLNKIAYFRVDLMFELYCAETKIELSNWDKHVFETIERARLVEKHPLMLVGKETTVTFKIAESGLDRIIDAFAVNPDNFKVTDEMRTINDSSDESVHGEKIVEVRVRTTSEEAFRWALANADVVELVSPQDIRDRLGRIADPIYQLYTQTLSDKVRENIDYVLKEGTFKISHKVDAETAYATYKELDKMGKLGVVDNMGIAGEETFDNLDYFGEFFNTERLILLATQIKDLTWVARLVNVKEFKLTNSQCEDVSCMREMMKLRRIYLSESQVSDLSCLSEHKEIDALDISGTNVSDISFIEDFPKLTQLHIAMCPIEDYSPLFTTKSRIKYLEIDKKALEKIGEENIRNHHIGIDIKVTNNSPFWYL